MSVINLTAAEHLRRLQWGIAKNYAQHELLAEQYWDDGRGARWVIGRLGTGLYLAEIIAGIGGSLIVHGDVQLSRFAHYGDHADAYSRLRWMGCCNDVGYYVQQKATIGMGDAAEISYNFDVARVEMLAMADEYERDQYSLAAVEVLREAAAAQFDTLYELNEFLCQHDGCEDMWEHDFGRVVPFSVVQGHLALQRCVALLEAKYGPQGPPACRPGGVR